MSENTFIRVTRSQSLASMPSPTKPKPTRAAKRGRDCSPLPPPKRKSPTGRLNELISPTIQTNKARAFTNNNHKQDAENTPPSPEPPARKRARRIYAIPLGPRSSEMISELTPPASPSKSKGKALLITEDEAAEEDESHLPTPPITVCEDFPSVINYPDVFTHALSVLSPSFSIPKTSTSSSIRESPIIGRESEWADLIKFMAGRLSSVYNFSDSLSLEENKSKTNVMYLTGPPGLGKTALLNYFMGELKSRVPLGRGKKFQSEPRMVMENCSSLGCEGVLWTRLAENLGCRHASFVQSKEDFYDYLMETRDDSILIVLDEIDYLLNTIHATQAAQQSLCSPRKVTSSPRKALSSPKKQRQSTLSALIEIIYRPELKNRVTLIGIANTLDLGALDLSSATRLGVSSSWIPCSPSKSGRKPAKLGTPSSEEPLPPKVITFRPYDYSDLMRVARHRLGFLYTDYTTSNPNPTVGCSEMDPIPLFDPKALEFAAKKISKESGDVRAFLGLLSKGVEAIGAMNEASSSDTVPSTPRKKVRGDWKQYTPVNAPKVTIPQMMKILRQVGMSNQDPLTLRIQTLAFIPRFVLISIALTLSRRTLVSGSTDSITQAEIYATYSEISKWDPLLSTKVVSSDSFIHVLDGLECSGWIDITSVTRSRTASPSSGIMGRSINIRGFGVDELLGGLKKVGCSLEGEGLSESASTEIVRISKNVIERDELEVARIVASRVLSSNGKRKIAGSPETKRKVGKLVMLMEEEEVELAKAPREYSSRGLDGDQWIGSKRRV